MGKEKQIWALSGSIIILIATNLFLSLKTKPIQESKIYLPATNVSLPTSSPQPTPMPLPISYQLGEGTHVFQTFNNCGPASLSMTLSFFKIVVSQKEIGDELRPWQNPAGNNDDKSVTLPELAQKAQDFGFTTYHRPNGDIQTLKAFIANDIPVITRTLLEVDSDIGHYRVVYGYDDNFREILQNDSLQGKNLKFNYTSFLNLWKPYGYEYLVLVPPEKTALAQGILKENLNERVAWVNATENLKMELSVNPQDIFLRFSLAVAYYNTGQYNESIQEFEAVEDKLPFRTLWYQIEPLLAYQKLMRYEELLPRIESVLANGNRGFSELYQIRGEIYLDLGNIEEARKQFELALFYNQNYEKASRALVKIGSE